MIHLKINARHPVPDDPMERDWVGWERGISPEDVYARNRGIWYFGARAERERYTVFSYDGKIVAVVENTAIEPVPGTDKKAIVGVVLGLGHPIHDALIDKPAPDTHRNPVTYAPDPDGPRTCACGCGTEVAGQRVFAPGHDQRAIHERIARQWGDTLGFITWFDATYGDDQLQVR